MDVLPCLAAAHTVPGAVVQDVAIEREADVVVLGDELLPNGLTIVDLPEFGNRIGLGVPALFGAILLEIKAGVVGVEIGVSGDDDAAIRMGRGLLAGPREDLVAGAELQRDEEKIPVWRGKVVGGVFQVPILEVGDLGAVRVVVRFEKIIEQGAAIQRSSVLAKVVVAGDERVRNARLLEQVHGLLGVLPLLGPVVIGDVAKMGDETDIVALFVRRYPFSLADVDLRVHPGETLTIRKHRERPCALRCTQRNDRNLFRVWRQSVGLGENRLREKAGDGACGEWFQKLAAVHGALRGLEVDAQ